MAVELVDILHDCRLFSEVSARSFQRLVAMARLRKFSKGQLIFREGQPCPGVFVVGRGLVRVFKAAPGGKEHVLHMVEPGQTFAEVAAIGGFDLPASAEAMKTTTCAFLPLESFRKALANDHELCLGIMTGLSLWVRHLVGMLEGIVLRDASGRLAQYLLDLAPTAQNTLTLPALKRHVASHLNLTSETLSRTLRRLADAGLIGELDKNRIRLLDRTKLERVAAGQFPTL